MSARKKPQTTNEACKAIDSAAKRRAGHLANESVMRAGKSGKLRNILQQERRMFGNAED